MIFGDYCRAKCTAPARFIGDGLCLYVSCQSNDFFIDEVDPAGEANPSLVHPTLRECMAATAGMRTRHRRTP